MESALNLEDEKDAFAQPTAERALLHFCFRDIEFFYTISGKMTENEFLLYDHRILYTLLCMLHKRSITRFDLPLVINEAQQSGILDSIGGMDYIQSIHDMDVSSQNFDIFLKDVLDASTKFKLFSILANSQQILKENAKKGKTSEDLIGSVENHILDLSTESRSIKEPRNLSEGLVEFIEARRKEHIDLIGISTGYPILNKQIDGLVPGTLNIFAARPKMGKSTLLSNMAAHAAYREGVPTLYIDTEMPFDQWRTRIIAGMSGVDERTIKHGGYNEETYRKLIDKCVRLVEKGKLFHEFMPGYTIDKLVAIYKKYKLKHGIGLMVFDYIKEPDLSSNTNQRKEYQLLGDVTTKLKDLAGELDIPAIAAVQINREGAIADSDRVARYADIIAFWGPRDAKEVAEWPQETGGTHKLHIREARRGGSTPKEGIGFHFYKQTLFIKEVDILSQMRQDVFAKGVTNEDSADEIR
jgi:replicative DNA helicase